MKFFKSVLVGSMFLAGTAIMYKDGVFDRSKTLKKGKKLMKKIGIM